MNFAKHLLVAGALAACATGPAHAVIRGTWLQMDIADPGVFTDTWSFDSTDFDPLDAGTGYQDYFIFNPPADEDITVRLVGDGVAFDHYTLREYADFSVVASLPAATADTLAGGPYALTSGTYWLDVFGRTDIAGGHYELQISGTQDEETPPPPLSPVPEPAGVGSMLAGLGLVAALGRKRRTPA